jgi:hypothetical protein
VQAVFSGFDLVRQFASHKSYLAPEGQQFCPVLAQLGSQEVLHDLPD